MTEMQKSMAVFSGSVNPELADQIAESLGITLGHVKLEKFSNGEIYARYLESVRGADVFIVQSVAGEQVNDALMELLIMTDAAKRASARTVTAVISHYGYSRQDRKAAAREPITAKLVANLMTVAGVDRTITIDLHQGQIQGFFDTPVNHLTALPILADYFKAKNLDMGRLCVVSPDVGRAKAAKKLSDIMEADLAIMHKGRPGHNQAEITALIGDVRDKICIINDDMIDTGGTLVAAVSTLKAQGADTVYVCATHPIFSGPAYERLENSEIEEVVVCNTIPVPQAHQTGKIKVVSVAPLLARAIANVYSNGSVSDLFDPDFAL
ncbi:ribose-phosphate diphosphokinase [Raoultibacter timonensis]|uniref:Ribose-phosphate pyrophosphokinase n=1 Tax=Raoultibacter timonensis TaxID=1907662 RepID=A0ABN6MBR6_9ACTN|nr:ribose-phosphate pyrophosphokinase [Raoultibacter timonensis]BDE95445.1 ribose-phosphate pyrophosphokinase [Raoultibacter timonensis]BDF50049.1 ribose-phosphate pyrophosphokinase [Raoultibacter timonensis]